MSGSLGGPEAGPGLGPRDPWNEPVGDDGGPSGRRSGSIAGLIGLVALALLLLGVLGVVLLKPSAEEAVTAVDEDDEIARGSMVRIERPRVDVYAPVPEARDRIEPIPGARLDPGLVLPADGAPTRMIVGATGEAIDVVPVRINDQRRYIPLDDFSLGDDDGP